MRSRFYFLDKKMYMMFIYYIWWLMIHLNNSIIPIFPDYFTANSDFGQHFDDTFFELTLYGEWLIIIITSSQKRRILKRDVEIIALILWSAIRCLKWKRSFLSFMSAPLVENHILDYLFVTINACVLACYEGQKEVVQDLILRGTDIKIILYVDVCASKSCTISFGPS